MLLSKCNKLSVTLLPNEKAGFNKLLTDITKSKIVTISLALTADSNGTSMGQKAANEEESKRVNKFNMNHLIKDGVASTMVRRSDLIASARSLHRKSSLNILKVKERSSSN